MRYLFLTILMGLFFQVFSQPKRLGDICSGICDGLSPDNIEASEMIEFKGKLYFRATDDQYGVELFEYDGVNAPTLAFDLSIGTGSSIPYFFSIVNNKLVFYAHDGVKGGFWTYDGINSPQFLISLTLLKASPYDGYKTIANNVLYFIADDGVHGNELWKYDGINIPSMVYDSNPGSDNMVIPATGQPGSCLSSYFLSSINDIIIFLVSDGTQCKLWKCDGTNVNELSTTNGLYGNRSIKFGTDLYLTYGNIKTNGITVTSVPGISFNPYIYNNKLYFNGGNAANGDELWCYDGVNNPFIVADINPGAGSSNASPIATLNNTLILLADNGVNGLELWRYDGINQPSLIADIVSGPVGVSVYSTAVLNNKLYFVADDLIKGRELWQYDGVNFPSLVADVNIGPDHGVANGAPLVTFKNKLLFIGTEGTNGWELWEYDSNPTSTSLLTKDDKNHLYVYPSPNSGSFRIGGDDSIQKVYLIGQDGCEEVYTGNKITTEKKGLIILKIVTKDNTYTLKTISQ